MTANRLTISYYASTFFYQLLILFVPAVSILEKRRILPTLKRAVSLSWNNSDRVLVNVGLNLLLTVIAEIFLFGCVLGGLLIFELLGNLGAAGVHPLSYSNDLNTQISILTGVVLALTMLMIMPLANLIALLLYYDIRSRNENYNEEALAEEMGYQPIAEMIAV